MAAMALFMVLLALALGAAWISSWPLLYLWGKVVRVAPGAARFNVLAQDLLEREVLKRRQNVARRRIREARFSDIKTLDQLQWTALQRVSKTKVQALSSGQFIDDAEDVVIIGPIGTGKTHLGIALGVEAARRRTRVLFVRAADLVRQLVEARDDLLLGRLHRRFQNIALQVNIKNSGPPGAAVSIRLRLPDDLSLDASSSHLAGLGIELLS